MIAALKKKRNCVCMELNPLLFINSQINVVASMRETNEKQQDEIEKEQEDINN